MQQQHPVERQQQHPEAAAAFTGFPDQQGGTPHQHRADHGRLRTSQQQEARQCQCRNGESPRSGQQPTDRQCCPEQNRQVKSRRCQGMGEARHPKGLTQGVRQLHLSTPQHQGRQQSAPFRAGQPLHSLCDRAAGIGQWRPRTLENLQLRHPELTPAATGCQPLRCAWKKGMNP